ncbi:hypothetical protein AAC387_Pa10g0394 [Persea americana]
MEGVVAVHELHIWAITVGKVLLACHVTITPDADADADLVLDKHIEQQWCPYVLQELKILLGLQILLPPVWIVMAFVFSVQCKCSMYDSNNESQNLLL